MIWKKGPSVIESISKIKNAKGDFDQVGQGIADLLTNRGVQKAVVAGDMAIKSVAARAVNAVIDKMKSARERYGLAGVLNEQISASNVFIVDQADRNNHAFTVYDLNEKPRYEVRPQKFSLHPKMTVIDPRTDQIISQVSKQKVLFSDDYDYYMHAADGRKLTKVAWHRITAAWVVEYNSWKIVFGKRKKNQDWATKVIDPDGRIIIKIYPTIDNYTKRGGKPKDVYVVEFNEPAFEIMALNITLILDLMDDPD